MNMKTEAGVAILPHIGTFDGSIRVTHDVTTSAHIFRGDDVRNEAIIQTKALNTPCIKQHLFHFVTAPKSHCIIPFKCKVSILRLVSKLCDDKQGNVYR
jgi:hypothetical protein